VIEQVREYKIISKIGEGGMGVVYKAYDENLERYVALKAIHSTYTSNEELLARFRNEAKVQASLSHPNIVSLYNFFKEHDTFFMVMEYIDGETLSQRIKRVGLIPPHRCIPMFIQVLSAIDYAHKKGVIHRDIKPSNILITKEDTIKVMDFGIAKIVGDRGLTKTGTKMGTIYYMSPEQIQGIKDIDARSDIYSLGITFFEMLTGRLPYNINTESDFAIMQQIVEVQIPSVKKYYPYVPEKVDVAIRTATMKNREERFQSCQEFIDFIKFEDIPEQNEVYKREITIPPIERKTNKELNLNVEVQTGYNTSSGVYEYPKASPRARIGAYFLDIFILGIPLAMFISIFEAGDEGSIVLAIILMIALIIIASIKDGLREGKGIGKGIVNLRTINIKTNKPISKGLSAVRNLINGIGAALYYLGFIADVILLFADKKGRRIADFILGTQVINEKDYKPNP
jgi:serine/threonine protein kinase